MDIERRKRLELYRNLDDCDIEINDWAFHPASGWIGEGYEF